jgi:large subunit ribosomal protein L6
MAKQETVQKSIDIPGGITFTLNSKIITATGPKGKCTRNLAMRGLALKLDGKKINISAVPMVANTANAHILNMIYGCQNGYMQKMKIIHAHFPMTVEIKGKEIIIKNFFGERQPRKARIMGDTKVEVKGTAITVSGPDKENVTQTVANLRSATRVVGRDSRVFQDGIYPVDE